MHQQQKSQEFINQKDVGKELFKYYVQNNLCKCQKKKKLKSIYKNHNKLLLYGKWTIKYEINPNEC